MNNDKIIEVNHLQATYGSTIVLKDVSFSVKQGEIFAILGGSGSGKSTILKHLIGLKQPAAGKIIVLNKNMGTANEKTRRKICCRFGVLYQKGALFGSMTVAENISLPLQEFTKLPKQAIADIAQLKLEMVGLEEAGELYPSELSGGMLKRASLARAMALDPELLFFDEPSSGLDPILAAELDNLILRIRDSLGTTMVIVTHDLDSTMLIADRVILVDKQAQGIIATGDPRTLANNNSNPAVKNFFNRCGLRRNTP